MRKLRLLAVIAMLAGGLALTTSTAFGTMDFAKKEKKSCTFCHTKMGSKELNDVGKCYQKNKNSLKGCEPKENEKQPQGR
jgi:hypothetical protein